MSRGNDIHWPKSSCSEKAMTGAPELQGADTGIAAASVDGLARLLQGPGPATAAILLGDPTDAAVGRRLLSPTGRCSRRGMAWLHAQYRACARGAARHHAAISSLCSVCGYVSHDGHDHDIHKGIRGPTHGSCPYIQLISFLYASGSSTHLISSEMAGKDVKNLSLSLSLPAAMQYVGTDLPRSERACAALTVSSRKISRRKAGLSIVRRRPRLWEGGRGARGRLVKAGRRSEKWRDSVRDSVPVLDGAPGAAGCQKRRRGLCCQCGRWCHAACMTRALVSHARLPRRQDTIYE